MKDSELGQEQSSIRNKSIGMMAIGTLDRENKELASTKGQNFAYLISRYTYRRDKIPQTVLNNSGGKSHLEILCKMNERVCKKASIEEIAISWRGLATLAREISDAKRKIIEAKEQK